VAQSASGRILRRTFELVDDVAEDLGPFIAGPRPSNPALGAYHDYTRWVCDSYSNVPAWAQTASAVAGVGWIGVDMSIGEICRPYLGNDGMPRAVPVVPGGQCDGVCYVVTIVADNSPNGYQFRTRGPIGGVRFVPLSGGGRVEVLSRSVPIPGSAPSCNALDVLAWRSTGLGGSGGTNPRVTATARTDGLPDNCGNVRPTAPTRGPSPRPNPGPNPPGGGQPPVLDPRGRWIFRPGPIRSPYNEPDTPCPPIDPYRPGRGDDDDPFYGPENPEPGDPGSPGLPSPTGEGGDAEGTAPADTELSGLRVDVLEVPPNANQYATGVYRGVFYAYMGNEAGLDQDYAGSMVTDGQFILAERSGLTRWRVSANPGYNVRVTPYYREVD
jgi:hypothetical protein